MKVQLAKASTSTILTVFIQDSSSIIGAGLGSLDQTSSIVGGYVRMGGTGVALAVDENVATEGTYEAPSAAGKVRIGTPANMRTGVYELHFHNDLFAAGADILTISLGGATDMADLLIEVQLTDIDLNSDDFTSTQKASINTEADNAVVTYGLDHLVAAAVVGTDVVDNSVIAKLVSKESTADWDDFVNTTDSLEAIRNHATTIKTETASILADTDDIGVAGAGLSAIPWNSSWDAEVESECDDALVAQKLDHLVAVADSDDAVDDSIIAKLATKAATANWSDFDNTTDSLEAIRDELNPHRIFSGTSTNSSTTTKVYVQAGDPPSGGADDDYNDTIIVIWDGSDKSTARVNIRVVDDYDDSDPSFTISPALGFTPNSGDLVEVYLADAGALTLLNALSSGFAATSPNRLIDHLRSMMSKAAVTPASVGTYDPAADSLEYQAERLALIEGSGFATGTDSLKQIRDAIDTLVAPSVVSSSALSGSGFLSDVVSLIRKATDEPGTTPKYTDGDIVELIQVALDTVLTDIHINTDHPIIIRYEITLVDGTQNYILPPNVGELIRVAKINSTTGLPEYEVWPGSYQNPGGCGWKLEGNVLRLLRDWDSTDTLELTYMPNSEPLLHLGTAEAVTATTITLMATPTDGTLGKRPNEYVGMLVRVLSSTENVHEERLITAYNVTTRVATINKAWDNTPTGTLKYEVVPIYSRMIKHLVALRASIDLLSQEGNAQRMATLNQNYAIKMSAMRRQVSKKEGRFPHHFDGDTWDNDNRSAY